MNAVQPAMARSAFLSSQVAASPGPCACRVEATSSAAAARAGRRSIPLSLLRFQKADFRFQITDLQIADRSESAIGICNLQSEISRLLRALGGRHHHLNPL